MAWALKSLFFTSRSLLWRRKRYDSRVVRGRGADSIDKMHGLVSRGVDLLNETPGLVSHGLSKSLFFTSRSLLRRRKHYDLRVVRARGADSIDQMPGLVSRGSDLLNEKPGLVSHGLSKSLFFTSRSLMRRRKRIDLRVVRGRGADSIDEKPGSLWLGLSNRYFLRVVH